MSLTPISSHPAPQSHPHLAKRQLFYWILYLNLLMASCYTWMYILWCLLLQPQMVSPPQSPWTLLKSTRLLSLLLNAKLFPTSGFLTCYFLCLECVSFCFSHDWVFLILQILTEMSLPQQSLSWFYCLKFPLLLSVFVPHFIHSAGFSL